MHARSSQHPPRIPRLLAVLVAGLLSGCAFLRPPTAPMAVTADDAPATSTPRVLLVLLPGVGDTPDDLIRHGMVEMVRERGIAADVVVADAHYGYYRTRQTVQRLWQDVIAPARSKGYQGVWLAGISIGGLGALLYGSAIEHGEQDPVTGVLSIAPYLGDDDVLQEVRAAGGLRSWQPSASRSSSGRFRSVNSGSTDK